MRKILLTSAGFENKNIERLFFGLLEKQPSCIKVLFVPTAAIDADAIAVLPKCMNDLLNAGIPANSITVYDLHEKMDFVSLQEYDVIYFCGGNTKHLLSRINENGFNKVLEQFVNQAGIYVGVSAGSVIATKSIPENLGYINCTINVHQSIGSMSGIIDTTECPHIDLTNNQAILITDTECRIIE